MGTSVKSLSNLATREKDHGVANSVAGPPTAWGADLRTKRQRTWRSRRHRSRPERGWQAFAKLKGVKNNEGWKRVMGSIPTAPTICEAKGGEKQ